MSARVPLQRREVVASLLTERDDWLVVSGLGSPTYDVAAAGDHEQNFYLWGAMGGAAMIGFGLASAQPKKSVVVITGDGEMLMGMGSLASIGIARPPNLTIIVLDNEHYAETGMQASHTGVGVDLVAVAAACGFEQSCAVADMPGVLALRESITARNGLCFASVKIDTQPVERVLPTRDGVYNKNRFRAALGLLPG